MVSANNHSSGNLTADRRVEMARGYADAGEFAAAAELTIQALELVPCHLPFMALAAGWHEKAGDFSAALGLWRDILAADPSDRFGAELKLAKMGALPAPEQPPVAYVESLFDDYAPRFDKALVERLDYCAPGLIFSALAARADDKPEFRHVIDLGCGTGLMGERLRRSTSFLEGMDLSDGMLKLARAKGVYDHLAKADLTQDFRSALHGTGDKADLVVAADVFIYCGALGDVFSRSAAMLESGGLFAFTVEAHAGSEDFVLRDSLRYAHSERYVRSMLEAAGFDVLALSAEKLRKDGAAEIEGYLVLASKRSVNVPDMLAGELLPMLGGTGERL